jgi:hypothetical protein
MKTGTHEIDRKVYIFVLATVPLGAEACSTQNRVSLPTEDPIHVDSGAPSSSSEGGDSSGSSVGNGRDAGQPPLPDAGAPGGYPPGADKVVGIDFMHRIVGQWTGTNNAAALGIAFPMTVDFEPSGPSFVFGRYDLDSKNDVLWGFNIETYGGKDVLAFRNGGYLGGQKRDSRLQLIEYNASTGYYRFCAVLESGVPVDGCNYIDARYTFTGPDAMTFDVKTLSGKPHVLWQAMRVKSPTLPDPFPASAASQGPGNAPWPAGSGL